jgi:hypothetical protein
VPDLAKIHRFVGYTPQVGLDQLLEAVIADCRTQPGAPAAAPVNGTVASQGLATH